MDNGQGQVKSPQKNKGIMKQKIFHGNAECAALTTNLIKKYRKRRGCQINKIGLKLVLGSILSEGQDGAIYIHKAF